MSKPFVADNLYGIVMKRNNPISTAKDRAHGDHAPLHLLTMICSALLSFASPARTAAFDIAEWVVSGDRRSNHVLSEMILSEDSETALRVIKALGERPDPYVKDIIEEIFFQYSDALDEEYFLEALFQSALANRGSVDRRSAWVEANAVVIDMLSGRLPHISNAFLKAHLLTCIPYLGSPVAFSRLMSEGGGLLQEMRRNAGFLPAGRIKEALAFFEAVEKSGSPDFLRLCLDMRSGSRQRIIVDRASRAVRAIRDLMD